MICPFCNAAISAQDKVCPVCGASVDGDCTIQETDTVTDIESKGNPGKVLGLIAMILGIAAVTIAALGYCCCGIWGAFVTTLMSGAGLVMGIIAMLQPRRAGDGNVKALVAIITSSAALLLSIAQMIWSVVWSVVWIGIELVTPFI